MGGSARTSIACFLCQWHVWWQGHTISPPLRAWPTPPRQPSRFAWIVNTEVRRAGRHGEAVACGSDESRGAPTIARCGDKKDLTFGAASPRARTPGSPSGIHDSPVPRKEVLHWAAFLTFLRASHFTSRLIRFPVSPFPRFSGSPPLLCPPAPCSGASPHASPLTPHVPCHSAFRIPHSAIRSALTPKKPPGPPFLTSCFCTYVVYLACRRHLRVDSHNVVPLPRK